MTSSKLRQKILEDIRQLNADMAEYNQICEQEAKAKGAVAVLNGPPKVDTSKPVFPELYSELLTVTDQGDSWYIKPREFLHPDDFKEIAKIIKQYDGTYVRAGKSSHFRIPKS